MGSRNVPGPKRSHPKPCPLRQQGLPRYGLRPGRQRLRYPGVLRLNSWYARPHLTCCDSTRRSPQCACSCICRDASGLSCRICRKKKKPWSKKKKKKKKTMCKKKKKKKKKKS